MKPIKSLKSLAGAFLAFVKQDFHYGAYIYTFVFIAVCVFINYFFGFYQNILRPSYAHDNAMWVYPLFYAFIYFAAAIPVLLLQKEYKTLKNPRFYLKSLFFIVIYGVSIGFYKYRQWEFPELFYLERNFVYRITAELKSIVFIVIPLIFVKLLIDRKTVKGFYGLSWNSKHLDAYLIVFIVMLPVLAATSFTPDFVKAYPQFRPWHYDGIFNLSALEKTLIFETAYSLDFVVTELFFRGALIIGLCSIMGPKTILPMVAFYVSIHFGKPVAETISSMFGGYILGVLAYQTKHIWGGIFVHIGIALTMEIMGFIRYY